MIIGACILFLFWWWHSRRWGEAVIVVWVFLLFVGTVDALKEGFPTAWSAIQAIAWTGMGLSN